MKNNAEANTVPPNQGDTVIALDMGTTNTRAWLVAGKEIVARKGAPVGVRDSARTGTRNIIYATLRELVSGLRIEAESLGRPPARILGAGMITSSLGLMELDHVAAPAGALELASAMRELMNPEITDLPIWLVPGVRTGPQQPEVADLSDVDVIRGEETLCVGLQRMDVLKAGSTLLNLGSHWKAITLDDCGRIASSFTTLSGELIHVIQKHTVLSSALPQERFVDLDADWLEEGRSRQRASGISRALFCVRILEQKFALTAVQRSSFLLGAVVESDLAAMRNNAKLGAEIVIAGSGAAVEAWRRCLEAEGRSVSVCDPNQVEVAFVAGLLHLHSARLAASDPLAQRRLHPKDL